MNKLKWIHSAFLLLLTGASFGQFENATYTNFSKQNLIISNVRDGAFTFKIEWGVNDEWGCMFSAEGDAVIQSESSAYYGDDPDMPSIAFTLGGNVISIVGGYDFIGDDCAKFGESATELYTVFMKEGSGNVPSEDEFDGPAPLGKSDATGYPYWVEFDGHCFSSENGTQFRIANYGTDTFVGCLSGVSVYDDGTEAAYLIYFLCQNGMYGENLDVQTWMEIEGYSEEDPAMEKITIDYDKYVIFKDVRYNLVKCE